MTMHPGDCACHLRHDKYAQEHVAYNTLQLPVLQDMIKIPRDILNISFGMVSIPQDMVKVSSDIINVLLYLEHASYDMAKVPHGKVNAPM
jgi:hypothetical protein